MKKILIILLSIGLIIGIVMIIYSALTRFSTITLGGKTFIIDTVSTDYSREKGLSGKKELSDNQGMFFIFPTPGNYGFWMKDMNFPIDIIWFDKDFRIIYIEKDISPQTYPKIFYPQSKSLYVLEISSGQSDKLNLKIGDEAIFSSK